MTFAWKAPPGEQRVVSLTSRGQESMHTQVSQRVNTAYRFMRFICRSLPVAAGGTHQMFSLYALLPSRFDTIGLKS